MPSSAACDRGAKEPPPAAAPAAERPDAGVRALADAYLEGYFQRNPDQVTLYGVPGRRHDALPDNSLDALRAWQAKEDGWLAQAKQIDPAAIEAPPLRGTYAIVREALEASIAARVCRVELWTVSQFVNGWQVQDGYTVTIQPVGNRRGAQGRARALEPAAEVRRHRNRQPSRRAQGRLLRAQGATSGSSSTR